MPTLPPQERRDCNLCGSRSHWDFLKEFYQREDINKAQIQSLNQHIHQLNAAVHHSGLTAQKDRIALNKAHEHLRELQQGFSQSELERAKFENLLHEERQEHRMCQEGLTIERVRHEDTEKHLESIWNSHKRMGDILSQTRCKIDKDMEGTHEEYDITSLVLEVEAKSVRIAALEATLELERGRNRAHGEELSSQIKRLEAKHAEEIATADFRLHELEMHHRREQARPFDPPIGSPGQRKRKPRRGRGRNSVMLWGQATPRMSPEQSAAEADERMLQSPQPNPVLQDVEMSP